MEIKHCKAAQYLEIPSHSTPASRLPEIPFFMHANHGSRLQVFEKTIRPSDDKRDGELDHEAPAGSHAFAECTKISSPSV